MITKIKEHLLNLISHVDALSDLHKKKQEEGEKVLIDIAKLKADIENEKVLSFVDSYRILNSYTLLVVEDMKTKINEIVNIYSFVKTTGKNIDFDEDTTKRLESFSSMSRTFFAFRDGKVQHKDTDFVDKLTKNVNNTMSGNKEVFLDNFKKSKLYAEYASPGMDKAV